MALRAGLFRRGVAFALVCAAFATVTPIVAEAAPAPALRRYPYLTDVVGTSATINWATDRTTATGTVTWGKLGSEVCDAHSTSATQSAITVGSVAESQWKAVLTLEADTRYCYRVRLASTDLLGTDATPSFVSQLPAGSTTPFSFAVFGDWGYTDSTGTNPDQANLMRQVAASGVRFALSTGDTAYGSGSQTNYGDLKQTGASVSTVFGPQFWTVAGASIPLFSSLGNHGLNPPNGQAFLTNWPQQQAAATSGGRYQMDLYPSVSGSTAQSYPSGWFAFDAGTARFYVLDAAWTDQNVGTTTKYDIDYQHHWTPSRAEYQWLENDLSAHPTATKFAFWHFPLYSDNPNESSDTFLRGTGSLEGLLSRYGVAMGFNGHAHTYQRNTKPNANSLVTYITGGGGATLSPISSCSATDAYGLGWSSSGGSRCGSAPVPTSKAQVYHFLKVTVNGSNVTVAPTDSLGRTFDVMTYNVGGGGDVQPPSAPSGLTASAVSSTRVDLSWSASTDNVVVTDYDVFRGSTKVGTVSGTTFSDTTVVGSTSYSYTVKAHDAAGNVSGASNTATVTTPGSGGTATVTFAAAADASVKEASPTSNYGNDTTLVIDGAADPDKQAYLRFTATGLVGTVSAAKLRLWVTNATVDGPAAYAAANSTWTETGITWTNKPGPTGVASDNKTSIPAGAWVEYDVKALVTGNGTYSFVLIPESTDDFIVAARNDPTNPPQLAVTTTSAGGDVQPPSAPTALMATATSSTIVDLSWSASTDNVAVTGYEVFRGTTNVGAATGTTFTDNGVVGSTTYSYTVKARDAAGNESGTSNTASVMTPDPEGDVEVPSAPTDLMATATSSTSVDLSWSASTDNVAVTGYDVFRGTTNVGAATGTAFTDNGVVGSTTYSYTVKARDAAGNVSAASNAAPVTTPPATGTATVTFAAEADASVKEATPTKNYGNDTTLVIDGGADPDKQVYLRFTATGLTGTVTAAKLRLWVTNATIDGPALYLAATNAWTETGITWANKPGPTGVACDNKTVIPAGAWVEYDVLALITGNGTFSFVLMPESADDFIVAARNDPTNPPQLVITTTA